MSLNFHICSFSAEALNAGAGLLCPQYSKQVVY